VTVKKRHLRVLRAIATGLVLAAPIAAVTVANAQEKVVAKVNGKNLTESDLKYADAEIGADIGNLPEATRRRVLIEYLIENQLFADAAETQKLGTGAAFDERLQYWRRRALRETFFDTSVKNSVSEDEAKKLYDAQVAQLAQAKPEEEVKASHILVKEEALAKELAAKLKAGDEKGFAEAAKANSLDPGSKEEGGSLGYFGKGQMVPQFEEAAFKLQKGELSAPIQTQFGWHIIRLDDRREKPAPKIPEFAAVKERIIASLMHKKAQETLDGLRSKATLEYVDPDVKKQVEAEKAAPAGAQPPKQ
jgi:peptidyl-prolyl cis-trans isomerase C